MTNNSRLGRRRSQRVTLCVPIVVSEQQANHRFFIERTHTLGVNRYGGLIALRCSVDPGQRLLVTHAKSRVSKVCRVVYLGPTHQDKRQVGVEFEDADSNFWNISFPAPGARPYLD